MMYHEVVEDVQDGDIGPVSTPWGVHSPVARRAIDEPSIASVSKMHGETNVHVRDADVGLDSTPL